jgi:feruloyl esterase
MLLSGDIEGSDQPWYCNNFPKTQASEYLRYAVFQDANWDFATFDFDSAMAFADRIDDGVTRATDPNLRDFFHRGYNSVLDFMASPADVRNSYRLFMAPGMDHCGGGDGPSTFDSIRAIEEWVETGKAPDQLIASPIQDGKTERTRPLCPYPQLAKYKGTGSTDDAANFFLVLGPENNR